MQGMNHVLTIAPRRPGTSFPCFEHDYLGRIWGIIGSQKMVQGADSGVASTYHEYVAF